jgi:hypothetical protein
LRRTHKEDGNIRGSVQKKKAPKRINKKAPTTASVMQHARNKAALVAEFNAAQASGNSHLLSDFEETMASYAQAKHTSDVIAHTQVAMHGEPSDYLTSIDNIPAAPTFDTIFPAAIDMSVA